MNGGSGENRELNPQLFGGNRANVDKIGNTVDPRQPASSPMGRAPGDSAPLRQVPYAPNEIKLIEQQVATLRVGHMQMEKRTEAVASKHEELARVVHARLERFAQALLRLEENQVQNNQDTTGKFAQIAARVNERKISDNKVQELVDRHNTIIRNFENRLISLQRLVSEQEMSLHNAQAALEEARSEIIRLKRL